MDKGQMINYIAGFLGIDVNNDFILADLEDIPNKQEFIKFMCQNANHIDLKYLNALQKLSKLKAMFNANLNETRLSKADDESVKLADKIRAIKCAVKNATRQTDYKHIRHKESKDHYFNKFETDVLSKIGDLRYVVMLDDIHRLDDEIAKAFKQIVLVPKTSHSIELKTKKLIPNKAMR